MPTYTFYDESSGIEWDEFLSMAQREKFLKENTQIRQVLKPVALTGDHLMGVGPKTDGGFNENMSRIAAAHPNSPLADKYGSGKTNAQIKAENIVKKYK
jgi:hypothetical protein